jgi:hypothetical protein
VPLYRTPLVSKDQPVVILTGPNAGCVTSYFQTVLLSISGFADTGAAASPDVTQLTADVSTISGQITVINTSLAGKAPLASPTFTGNPAAPTPALGDNDTSIATTAFVQGELTDQAVKLTGAQTVAGIKTFSSGTRNRTVTGPTFTSGTGSPETVVTAPIASIYQREDGGAGTCLYVKESGSGNTGWVAK